MNSIISIADLPAPVISAETQWTRLVAGKIVLHPNPKGSPPARMVFPGIASKGSGRIALIVESANSGCQGVLLTATVTACGSGNICRNEVIAVGPGRFRRDWILEWQSKEGLVDLRLGCELAPESQSNSACGVWLSDAVKMPPYTAQSDAGETMHTEPKLCAITMAYNEAANLPRWLSYYSNQVGIENCIIVDHSSSDGSTAALRHPVSRLRLSRHRPFDEHPRAKFISGLVNSMLEYYDGVIYVDSDEYLVADPAKYSSLRDFFSRHPAQTHFTALGFDVVHLTDREPPLKPDIGLLTQRRHSHFNFAMCKTSFVRTKITYGGGFHSSNLNPFFSDLYLFHSKGADLTSKLERAKVTRSIDMRNAGEQNPHWRFAEEEQIKRQTAYQKFTIRLWNDEAKSRIINELSIRLMRSPFGEGGRDWRYHFQPTFPKDLYETLFEFPEPFNGAV